jgi:hypothetical protein
MDQFPVVPRWAVYLLFIVGVLSAVAFRALIVVGHVAPSYMRIVWYCGVTGYLIFFLYRYIISRRRKRIIRDVDLLSALEEGKALTADERKAMVYVVTSIDRSLETYNYYIIFALSLAAIGLDLYLEF